MTSFRPVFACFLLVFFACSVFGQPSSTHTPTSPLPHTLLWRISGKGLKKPSYLYGTLHLNDKRLFNFDDSVYRAIEKTDGLAIEVNPDEMAAYFVNQLLDQLSNGKKLKDVLGDRYFEKNRKALAKKFNKPADDISTSDIVREKNKWMSEYMKKGEMPTFMDAWLYNVARRQGKWLGGIEDLTDQTGLMSDLVDRSDVDDLLASDNGGKTPDVKGGLEQMISLYSNQDVDGIRNFTQDNSTPEQEDKILTHRNIKMARRIDSLIAVRTMFLAIGSAHLAGDSGVISLLRRRGLTVEPVFSTKKIAASDYTFKEVHLPWVAVTDQKGYYTAEMPANPASVKLFGLVEMKFLLDLFNMSGYCTMAVVNSNRGADRDSLFDELARRMMHGQSVKPVRRLEQNGITGREYIQSTDEGNLRVQVFMDDRMLYMAMVSSLKKEVLLSADADKFFKSFAIRKQVGSATDAIQPFTDSVMGISFLSPSVLEHNEKMSASTDSWKVTCYTGADPATGAYVMLFSKDVRPGYYIDADSTVQNDFVEKIKLQYDRLDQKEVVIDGARGLRIDGRNIANPKIFASTLSLLKNGRNLLIVIVSDSARQSDPRLQGVFSSLRLLPRLPGTGTADSPGNGKWICTAPSPMRPLVMSEDAKLKWVSYDTTTSVSYQVIPDTLSKYHWYANDSVFWNEKIDAYRLGGRYNVTVTDVVNGDRVGKELFVESKGNVFCKRSRLILDGDILYELFVSGEKDFLYSDAVNTFFTSFRLKTPPGKSVLTTSKTALLLHDLAGADSSSRHDAYMALYDAPFEKKDGPLLRGALFQRYRSPFGADSTVSTLINDQLARHIAKLDDSSSVSFIRDTYGSLTGEKGRYRNAALGLLAKQHTAYSYAVLGDLLAKGPISERLELMTVFALKDSMRLTSAIFPVFRTWAGDTLQAPPVADLVGDMLDSGCLHLETITPWAPAFIGAANALLPGLKKKEHVDESSLTDLLQLIGRWHTPAAYAVLRGYLTVKDKDLSLEASVQLAAAGQQVPASVLLRLAADPTYRMLLYERLKEKKRTAVFPARYSTQAYFAESAVYQAINADVEDSLEDEKVEFLSKKTALFKGARYTWYLYKVSYTEEGNTVVHLGVAGGYAVGSTTLKPKIDLTDVYWTDEYDGNNASSLFKAFLEKQNKTEDKD